MPRVRATNSSGNRSGNRVRAKVTTPRTAPRKISTVQTQFGRGLCPNCREMKPLLSSGKLRGHAMYGAICVGVHKSPVHIEGEL